MIDDEANETREAGWSEAFSARAAAYWTQPRIDELTRGKTLAVTPHEAPLLLRALGILHRDASMPPKERRKFFQINHMVAMIMPTMRDLAATGRTVRVVDAACGASYLTLLLAWSFKHRLHCEVEVLGVDRNEALMQASRQRTRIAGLGALVKHHAASLAKADVSDAWMHAFGAPLTRIDVLVALHACDTASDDAIVLGCDLGAHLLAVAPCCQAELAAAWAAQTEAPHAMSSMQKSPHLRRELGALTTDTMRMLLLRTRGYETWALEFVPTEHSAKNRLLRAVLRGSPDVNARAEYEALRDATGGVGIKLASRV